MEHVEVKITTKPKDQPYVLIQLLEGDIGTSYTLLVTLEKYEAKWKPLLESPRPPNSFDTNEPDGDYSAWQNWTKELRDLADEEEDGDFFCEETTIEANIVKFVQRILFD